MSQPRRVIAGQSYLVTRRTLRRYFLLRPDAALNQLFLYLVAFFAHKFGLEVAAIQVLASHYHLVVTDVRGLLPEFVRELHRVVALCVKVLRKWEGPVWEPCSVSVVELLTAEAEAQQTRAPSSGLHRGRTLRRHRWIKSWGQCGHSHCPVLFLRRADRRHLNDRIATEMNAGPGDPRARPVLSWLTDSTARR